MTYSENSIPKINNELVNVMHKLRLCEKDVYLNNIEKRLVCVSDSLRKDSLFKHVKEVHVKQQVWVKVEEVKMLSEVKDPLLDLKIVACMN